MINSEVVLIWSCQVTALVCRVVGLNLQTHDDSLLLKGTCSRLAECFVYKNNFTRSSLRIIIEFTKNRQNHFDKDRTTRGTKGHMSCTWVLRATFKRNRPGQPFLFTDQPETDKLGRGCWGLASCKVQKSIQRFQRRSRKWLTDQKPGRSSCFSNRQEKDKLGRGGWYLTSCQVSLNSVMLFPRRSRKCLNQSEVRAAILFFRSAQKTQTS